MGFIAQSNGCSDHKCLKAVLSACKSRLSFDPSLRDDSDSVHEFKFDKSTERTNNMRH